MNGDSVNDRAGTIFGPYRLVRLLGRGGMGEVYLAHDTVKGRDVALKLLHAGVAQDPGFRGRFTHESQTAARLSDPHVIPIPDYGEIEGTLYLDMRLVDGNNLAELVAPGPLSPERAVDLVAQVASALDSAHLQGLVHRDVKPANIQVTPSGFAYLLDFGRVVDGAADRLTSAGLFVGSQAYAAPERFDGGGATPAGDVYSLACVLYELLAGRPPVAANSISEMMRHHLLSAPPRASAVAPVPAALDAVIAKGMAKRPEERYATCGSLARAATAALRGTPQSWGTTTTVPSAPGPAGPPSAPLPTQISYPHGAPSSSGGPQYVTPSYAPPAAYPPAAGAGAGAAAPPPRNRALIPVLALVAVLLVAAIAAAVVLLRGGGSSTPVAATTTTPPPTSVATATSAAPSTTPTVTKAAQPANTEVCPGDTGQVFGTVAADRGSGVPGEPYTSCEFAAAIAAAYRAAHTAPQSGPVSAVSPRAPDLGAIAMSCIGTTNIVTCRGGNNAIVYLY